MTVTKESAECIDILRKAGREYGVVVDLLEIVSKLPPSELSQFGLVEADIKFLESVQDAAAFVALDRESDPT